MGVACVARLLSAVAGLIVHLLERMVWCGIPSSWQACWRRHEVCAVPSQMGRGKRVSPVTSAPLVPKYRMDIREGSGLVVVSFVQIS